MPIPTKFDKTKDPLALKAIDIELNGFERTGEQAISVDLAGCATQLDLSWFSGRTLVVPVNGKPKEKPFMLDGSIAPSDVRLWYREHIKPGVDAEDDL